MKKILLAILLIFTILPTNVYASENNRTVTIEYLDNGMIVETVIEESSISLFSTQTKSGSKTNNYKNSNGTILYSVKVSGTFTYTGTTSICTSSSVTATSYVNDWKVDSKSASKSKNKATAKATMKQYLDNRLIQTTNPSVTLTCSATGKLS